MIKRRFACFLALAVWAVVVPGLPALDPPSPVHPMLIERYEMTGEGEEKYLPRAESEAPLVRQAIVRAVRATAGRVYFSDRMMRSIQLLNPYLSRYAERFAPDYRILSSEMRGGRRTTEVEVYVDAEKLFKDLHEKRFLYRPAFRPIYTAFIAETLNGKPVASQAGRKHLIQVLNDRPDRKFRFLWTDKVDDPQVPVSNKTELVPESPRGDADVSGDIGAVCAEIERYGVEFFLTGTIKTHTTRSESLYLDEEPTQFVQSVCALKLVRADTGEVVSEAKSTKVAGHTDLNEAMRKAAQDAVDEVAATLFKNFNETWGNTVLQNADLRLMVLGADAGSLNLLRNTLGAMTPKAKVYTRSNYGGVAVLTLSWDGDVEDLIQVLAQTRFPNFAVEKVDDAKALILKAL